MNRFGLLAVMSVMLLVSAVGARAADQVYATGFVSADTPVIKTPDRAVDRTTQLHGLLELHNLLGPVSLNVGGDLCTNSARRFRNENKLRVGAACPLTPWIDGYVTWERRFGVPDDRIVAGVKWSFVAR